MAVETTDDVLADIVAGAVPRNPGRVVCGSGDRPREFGWMDATDIPPDEVVRDDYLIPAPLYKLLPRLPGDDHFCTRSYPDEAQARQALATALAAYKQGVG